MFAKDSHRLCHHTATLYDLDIPLIHDGSVLYARYALRRMRVHVAKREIRLKGGQP